MTDERDELSAPSDSGAIRRRHERLRRPAEGHAVRARASWSGSTRWRSCPAARRSRRTWSTQILEESAKFATEVLSPLNWSGDQEGAQLEGRRGHHAAGLQGGLPAVRRRRLERAAVPEPNSAGRGCRKLVATPVRRCGSRRTCPSRSARCSPAARSRRCCCAAPTRRRRLPAEDGRGRVDRHHEPDRAAGRLGPRAGQTPRRAARATTTASSGQKIFITYGEHDMAENIVHLVLARTPDAPEGVKGISLFVVPKFLVERRRHARASATTCSACRSSTSSASTRARPRDGLRRQGRARSATWWARRTAASSTCSS